MRDIHHSSVQWLHFRSHAYVCILCSMMGRFVSMLLQHGHYRDVRLIVHDKPAYRRNATIVGNGCMFSASSNAVKIRSSSAPPTLPSGAEKGGGAWQFRHSVGADPYAWIVFQCECF